MVGKTLGHYKILEPLGAGGMGEVYLGEDARLGRKVAVKVLPPKFAADAERLGRFEQEARAAAALNHPHIAVVYDIGAEKGPDGDTTHFIVQEYLAGQDLRQRVTSGPLTTDEALRCAAEIADGLAAAHAAGVVHRDLKPDNVFLTRDGHAKILDFGLAKLFTHGAAGSGGDASMSPTSLGTAAGQPMGTAAYMSPEQARGETVDQRADVWAFGVLLYEMLTGKRLFTADSVSDTVAAVLRDDIDLDALPADLPYEIRRLLGRCVERDPRRRLHHLADARIELEDAVAAAAATSSGPVPAAATGPPAHAAPGSERPAWRQHLGYAFSAILLALLALSWFTRPQDAPQSASMRLPVHLSPGVPLDMGVGPAFALSPDGTRIAYAAGGQIWVRSLDRLEVRALAVTDGVEAPMFSPDGEWIAYFTTRQLMKVSVDGGTPLELATTVQPRGGAWVGNRIVYAPATSSGLWTVSDAGGDARQLTTPADGERSHRWPGALPGASHALFIVQHSGRPYGDSGIAVVALDTGEYRIVHEGGTFPRYAHTGHLLFARGSTLFAAPFGVDSLTTAGPALPVLRGLLAQSGGEQVDSGSAQFDISASGTLAYFPDVEGTGMYWLVSAGKDGDEQRLDLEPLAYSSPRYAPDGERIAVHVSDGNGSDVWVFDAATGSKTRVTFDGNSVLPIWTPDGNQLAYSRGANIFLAPARGGGAPQQISETEQTTMPGSFSADGRYLAYLEQNEQSWDIGIIDVEARTMEPPVATPANELWPEFSPDGRWIAFVVDDGRSFEIYVRAFQGDGAWQISTEGGIFPRWAADGSELYFHDGRRMMAVEVQATDDTFGHGPPRELFTVPYADLGDFPAYDVRPDGERFLVLRRATADSAADEHVAMVFDFFSVLRATAGATASQ